jgi:hypothetical protein
VDAVPSALLLGFALGLQHATDPDHVVAVATIVTRERRFLAGAWVGLFWGIGHTVTLAAAGVVVIVLNLSVPVPVATGLELLVAMMLVTLGIMRLREAARGILAVAPDRREADHVHDVARSPRAAGVIHAHHGAAHVHPSARLLAAWRNGAGGVGTRALLVGAIHGMAGTAAVGLLVLTTVQSAGAAAVSLMVFGIGTIAGMTALTGAMAYPVARLTHLRFLREAMAAASGVAAIVFGCWYAARFV